MKTFLLIVITSVFLIREVYSQWFWQNPLPQSNPLYSVKFIDANTGWAVGELGTIIKTTDGGINWTVQSSDTIGALNSVCFVNANIGWVAGANGTILKTTNGGLSWTPQSSGTTRPLYSIYFTNSNIGWAVGETGIILKTTNGGVSWFD
ncbi:MAG: YCF48-related protein, partial [Ignavibacterium sp.]|nr:YCF48-related protein [Ignavibacterium sp.]